MSDLIRELELIYQNLCKANGPEEVFGDIGEGSKDDQKERVKALYRKLSKTVHPDKYAGDARTTHMAEEGFITLNRFYDEATVKIEHGTYGKNVQTPTTTNLTMHFKAAGFDYRMGESVTGDFATVMFGEREDKEGQIEKICLKIPLDPKNNDLMQTEMKVLMAVQHKSMPVLLGCMMMEGKFVNVLRRVENGIDLTSLREQHFPQGLPQEHMVWVLDRLLSVLGFLHINHVIHGAIEPGNILVVPNNHNAVLVDYALAVPEVHLPGASYKGVTAYTAPEVLNNTKISPHPAADMYSLGATMLYLLGGDAANGLYPFGTKPEIKVFLERFLVKNPNKRFSDAWTTWHLLKKLRKEVFGAASQFLPLTLK